MFQQIAKEYFKSQHAEHLSLLPLDSPCPESIIFVLTANLYAELFSLGARLGRNPLPVEV